ncbi:response regulator [Brevundimonas sp.]|uniref:response regulator n=1 Tax=Brevundimonas sp. TaxID=1871086 RepID=UPI003BAC4604
MPPPATRLNLGKSRALLVDDNQASLDLLSQVLAGFHLQRLRTCLSAAEARGLVSAEKFDLIFIDYAMPGEDGLHLARHIRSDPMSPNQTAPIVILHGFTPEDMVMNARDAGANMIIRKPVVPAILLSRLEWIARDTREFVDSARYRGPDRRIRSAPLSPDVPERRADALALIGDLNRAMSQDDVTALFG